jgi:glycosyltransferase involved in cell wall biosynthesis
MNSEFDIVVCYSKEIDKGSLETVNENIDFEVYKLPRIFYRKNATAMLQNPISILFKFKPEIVISEGAPSYITLWFMIILKTFFRFKLSVWSHGIKYTEMVHPFHTMRGKVQLFIFNWADSILLYSDERADIIKKYINRPQKVFVARNTLDTDSFKNIYDKLSSKGKDIVRSEIGFNNHVNLIYVGRLIETKKIADVIYAVKILSVSMKIAFHIVGEGPERKSLEDLAADNNNIKFYGKIFDPFLTGKMIYCSDIMVNPGYIGLSIIHAFSFGCPVITYRYQDGIGPVHSPEVEYLKEGINGVFCNHGPDFLAKEIKTLIQDTDRLKEMSCEAIKTAYNEASISIMMEGIRKMLEFLKNSQT